MAAKSTLLPLLRCLSRPYMSIQKAPLLSSLQSSLFHASTEPRQSISMLDQIHPPGGLQTKSVLDLLQSGSLASNCKNYAEAHKPMSDDNEDIDEVDFEDNGDEDMDFNEDSFMMEMRSRFESILYKLEILDHTARERAVGLGANIGPTMNVGVLI